MVLSALLASAAAGCAIVDDVGLRSETMNDSMAQYNNHSILLNIVRASEYEPLNFVAVTQASPNTSIVGTAAGPTLGFNPYHLASTMIQGNSVSSTASNQLTIQPIDDPASWQAMLTPVDVGTIGFFIKQNYPPELLFWLFIDRIRITTGSKPYEELINYPEGILASGPGGISDEDKERITPFTRFSNILSNMIEAGLTVDVERGAPKTGQTPAARICFKRSNALAAKLLADRLPAALAPQGQDRVW